MNNHLFYIENEKAEKHNTGGQSARGHRPNVTGKATLQQNKLRCAQKSQQGFGTFFFLFKLSCISFKKLINRIFNKFFIILRKRPEKGRF